MTSRTLLCTIKSPPASFFASVFSPMNSLLASSLPERRVLNRPRPGPQRPRAHAARAAL
jgi:hypothetical protein